MEFLSIQQQCFRKRHILKDREKGLYTKPIRMQRPAANEEEWFAEVVKKYVSASVLAECLDKLKPKTVRALDGGEYWARVKEARAELVAKGLTPLLLLEDAVTPQWIADWQESDYLEKRRRPEDMELTRNPEFKWPEYLGGLNDISIFHAPIPPGASFVMAWEAFASLVFKKIDGDRFVVVKSQASSKSDELVDLVIEWEFDLSIEPHPVWKLDYST